jgi:hypothetical protein
MQKIFVKRPKTLNYVGMSPITSATFQCKCTGANRAGITRLEHHTELEERIGMDVHAQPFGCNEDDSINSFLSANVIERKIEEPINPRLN